MRDVGGERTDVECVRRLSLFLCLLFCSYIWQKKKEKKRDIGKVGFRGFVEIALIIPWLLIKRISSWPVSNVLISLPHADCRWIDLFS